MIEEIHNLSESIHSKVIANRRHLHTHPELSFQEYHTSEFVKSKLDELSIPWIAMADTGVVGMIEGELPSDQVIALRADMDALPIHETNLIEYASRNAGVMHACGHDAHTSSLLGTASILQTLKSKFGGRIKLIFQPGEEVLPGGASLMIKEGVLNHPKPNDILGQHVMPSIPCGKVAFRTGKLMASTDTIYMTIHGRGGHGAQPHMNIDPVIISAHVLIALQQIVSRMANPLTPSVLSFGKVIADGAFNVIPDKVTIEGTFRTLDEEWRSDAHEKITLMAQTVAKSLGGSCEIKIIRGYPYLINEEKLTLDAKKYAQEYLGKERVLDADIWMAAEDFAYYSQQADACFYFLGVGNKEKGIVSSLHTADFNLDETALSFSTGLMAYMALKRLGN